MGMSEAERIRSFIAIDLAEPVRAAIATLQRELAGTNADVRWVRTESMHVTLRFLGAVEAERLNRVHAAVAAALQAQPPLDVRAHGVGAFPSLRRPRVLWAGLQSAGLVELAACVDATTTALGFAPELRAFTPHITLGRVNSQRGWGPLETQLTSHLDDDFGASTIEAVTIYRSTLRPTGAIYTPLWTMTLNKYKQGEHYDNRC
jgi:RNA 2',3'-cyclic 3'-phosphodiesterase